MFGPKKRDLYQPYDLGDMSYFEENDQEEWLRRRENGPHWKNPDSNDPLYFELAFGASTISAIFDESPWLCSLELFHKKVGIQPDVKKEFNPESKLLGHIYEPAISEAFLVWMRKHYPTLKVKKGKIASDGTLLDKHLFRHGQKNPDGSFKYPWAVINLDGLIEINGQPGILEIKRATNQGPDAIKKIEEWKNGIVPKYYELQCRYQMAVMNVQYAYIVCSWGHLLSQMAVIRIDRNYEVEDSMMKTIGEFAEMCIQGIEPSTDRCIPSVIVEYYSRLYGKVDPILPEVRIPESYRDVVIAASKIDEEIKLKSDQLKIAQEKRDAIYKALYPLYGKATYGTYRLDTVTLAAITLKSPCKRDVLDVDRLKTEQPDIYQKYATAFDTKKFKKEEKKLTIQYTIPGTAKEDEKQINSFTFKLKNCDVRYDEKKKIS